MRPLHCQAYEQGCYSRDDAFSRVIVPTGFTWAPAGTGAEAKETANARVVIIANRLNVIGDVLVTLLEHFDCCHSLMFRKRKGLTDSAGRLRVPKGRQRKGDVAKEPEEGKLHVLWVNAGSGRTIDGRLQHRPDGMDRSLLTTASMGQGGKFDHQQSK